MKFNLYAASSNPTKSDFVLFWQNATQRVKSMLLAFTGTPIPTISDLKSLNISEVSTGQVVNVAGYNSAGDGGGGSFTYSSSSPAANDGGLVISPNVGSGKWIRNYSGRINIKWFGVVSDGTTDQTALIQSALNNVPAGSCVYFPAGRYLFSSLSINQMLTIEGDGWTGPQDGSTFGGIGWDEYSGTILESSNTGVGRSILIGENSTQDQPYNLMNLAIIGPGTGSSTGVSFGSSTNSSAPTASFWSNVLIGNFSTGLFMYQAEQNYMYSLRIRGCSTYGVSISDNATNANVFYGLEIQLCNSVGFNAVGGQGNKIIGGLFQSNGGTSIYLDTSFGYLIQGCWFENDSSSGKDIRLKNTQGCSVKDNYRFGKTIYVEGSSSRLSTIEGNVASTPDSIVLASDISVPILVRGNQGFTTVDNGSNKWATWKESAADQGSRNDVGDTATPTTANSDFIRIDNSGATNVTGFLAGLMGKEITVVLLDNTTTLKEAAGGANQLILKGGVDYNPPTGSVVKFIYDVGTGWRETSRTEP